MLDVDHLKWSSSGGGGGGSTAAAAAAAASLLADVEDTMEDMAIEDAAMLFDLDDDWLHEHNLDVLFDLFEEELEGSGKVDSSVGSAASMEQQQQQLGSSPITSYLFGSSASSLASALDLYDLLYFDATQQQQQPQQQPSISTSQTASPSSTTTTTTTTAPTNLAASSVSSNGKRHNNDARHHQHRPSASTSSGSSSNQSGSGNNSLNVMRIKRRLKRGQSEGVSLLAKPNHSEPDNSTHSHIKTSDKNNSSNNSTTSSLTNSPSSKKLSTTTTTTTTTNRIDISNNKGHQQQPSNRHIYHYHQHLHYITGCSVIREHAYAAVHHPTIQIN